MQKDFQRSLEQLAERQVKETILMDAIAFKERLDISHDDVKNYLNLTKRMRTREFIHFRLPSTKVRGQEEPIITQELMTYCLREKALNHIIYHLTKK
jgi:FKBP-type peptidyl-prolyl cis-trans isomerase (trigger factor)